MKIKKKELEQIRAALTQGLLAEYDDEYCIPKDHPAADALRDARSLAWQIERRG